MKTALLSRFAAFFDHLCQFFKYLNFSCKNRVRKHPIKSIDTPYTKAYNNIERKTLIVFRGLWIYFRSPSFIIAI